jgi:hypothetical protein
MQQPDKCSQKPKANILLQFFENVIELVYAIQRFVCHYVAGCELLLISKKT